MGRQLAVYRPSYKLHDVIKVYHLPPPPNPRVCCVRIQDLCIFSEFTSALYHAFTPTTLLASISARCSVVNSQTSRVCTCGEADLAPSKTVSLPLALSSKKHCYSDDSKAENGRSSPRPAFPYVSRPAEQLCPAAQLTWGGLEVLETFGPN